MRSVKITLPLKYIKSVYGLLIIFLLLFFCRPVEDRVSSFESQSQINAAADFKAKQCNQPVPQPPLYVFTDQYKRNLDLCSIAITRLECPFDGYPIICMNIYSEEPFPTLPWQLNFDELTKVRFKF
jgi:hypothetical protein